MFHLEAIENTLIATRDGLSITVDVHTYHWHHLPEIKILASGRVWSKEEEDALVNWQRKEKKSIHWLYSCPYLACFTYSTGQQDPERLGVAAAAAIMLVLLSMFHYDYYGNKRHRQPIFTRLVRMYERVFDRDEDDEIFGGGDMDAWSG